VHGLRCAGRQLAGSRLLTSGPGDRRASRSALGPGEALERAEDEDLAQAISVGKIIAFGLRPELGVSVQPRSSMWANLGLSPLIG
jgi:hypothetical protein